ncbi:MULTISPECIES: DUF368 domain-containing protein [Staphylococcus]|uniref:DUF368 domain-containing protein n=1 Tax=Staphylococcus schleiferi TaxID=1295 RepID=A0A7Z7VXQ9_STASC|nr:MULTISPECIES: DUF368 domain-containing protein [Staphylococcus]QGS47029.1 DUF368 domain-containing protein [Mammaliicoccus fleurettii]EPD52976.1 hypothetical protein HMPREF1208_00312 [Staphylococcus sp. HGB0015]MBF1991953.1 DUF368 domain-containing protein [Staphylococcus schleiferi]MBF2037663.1 DUF368 domain-containing protein [Staphylococcus schleiferi]MBF2099615.1 DUF368 domain-containing protein [Staphylococcus schleiferi]
MSKFKISNIPRGFAMGISDLIPGVSGGTIALLLGIYDDFIASVSGVFSKHFKKSILFLLPIIIGMALAIGILSSVINYLLATHLIPTMFFFFGLILGIIPFLLRISHYKQTYKIQHWIIMGVAIIALALMAYFKGETSHAAPSHIDLSLPMLIKYFIAGVCASSAMLLPGISGSFILLLFGVYSTVTYSISEIVRFNFEALPVILMVGMGIVVGFLIASKVITYLLKHYTYLTYAAILGLVIGSLFSVFPGLPNQGLTWLASIITLILGFIISFILGRFTNES